MDSTELLAQLRDIRLPAAPPEPAVWPIVLSTVPVIVALVFFSWRHLKQPDSWATQARRELTYIQNSHNDNARLQIATLLKRIVVAHDKRPSTHQLTGEPWLGYLNSFFNTNYFSSDEGHLFGDALYQPAQTLAQKDLVKIIQTLRKLIRRKDQRS